MPLPLLRRVVPLAKRRSSLLRSPLDRCRSSVPLHRRARSASIRLSLRIRRRRLNRMAVTMSRIHRAHRRTIVAARRASDRASRLERRSQSIASDQRRRSIRSRSNDRSVVRPLRRARLTRTRARHRRLTRMLTRCYRRSRETRSRSALLAAFGSECLVANSSIGSKPTRHSSPIAIDSKRSRGLWRSMHCMSRLEPAHGMRKQWRSWSVACSPCTPLTPAATGCSPSNSSLPLAVTP